MTSQSSTINERVTKSAGFGAFFGFGLRQFWTTMLLFAIILFFVLPVPVLMIISQRALDNADVYIRVRNMFANEWAVEIRYALVPIMAALALVVSCSRFKYLKNKVSVDFYHSLPIKRGRLYVSQLAISALALVIPFVVNTILTFIFLASNGLLGGSLIMNFFLTAGEAFVYAAFIYAMTTFVGMVCGMTSVQITLTAVALAIVPATWLLGLAFSEIFTENMWYDFYLREESMRYMSPVLRFFMDTDPLTAVETLVSLLLTVLMLAFAYLVYTKRKSERSGTPVVFTPLGEVIKYVLMVIGTLLGGIFFYYVMNYDFIWTVFGMVCGALLVFMLTNTILNKTAKAMFKGWRGLLVFMGCCAIVMTVFMTNLFGINSYVPSPENTKKAIIRLDYGSTYEFTELENIEAVHRIYTEGEWSHDMNKYGGNVWWSYETVGISVVFYPKFGIPVAKDVRIYNKSDFIEEFRTILDSEEFAAQYTGRVNDIEGEGYMRLDLPRFRINPQDGELWRVYYDNGYWFESFNLNDSRAREMSAKNIINANVNCGFDHFQQQDVGELYINGTNRYVYGETYNFPIYTSMTAITDLLVENGFLSMTPEDTIAAYAELIDGIEIYYAPDGEEVAKTHKFIDKEQIKALLSASANIHGDTSSNREFTFVEPEFVGYYKINVNYGDYETYYSKEGYYAVDEDGYEVFVRTESADVEAVTKEAVSSLKETTENEFELAFLLGKMPNFVYEEFGIER